MRNLEFQNGEVIFREGELGSFLYEILEGRVEIILGYGTEKEQKLKELEPGQIFGEMAVLESWPRSATAVAGRGHTVVREISSDEMLNFFVEDPGKIRHIMEILSHRLREMTDEYTDVCGTIRQIRESRGEPEKREGSLLEKIGFYLNLYGRFWGNRKVLEAMETYDTIEHIKGEQGENPDGIQFDKGEVVFREGDPGDCIYYIAWGSVNVYTGFGTDSQKLLTKLGEDTFFGEMGLIEKLPRSATVVAKEKGTVLNSITEGSLDRLFKDYPYLIIRLLQHISSRLRRLTLDYVKACRTLNRMMEEEKGYASLTEDDIQKIEVYMHMAQTPYTFWDY